MAVAELTFQYFINVHTEVLGGGYGLRKFRQQIQVLVIVARQYLLRHAAIEIDQVANHASTLIDLAANGYRQSVVVAMPVRIVAFAINLAVLGLGVGIIVQTMRG